MPGPKNGERPYLAPSVPGFWDPFFGYFSGISGLPIHPAAVFHSHPNTPHYSFKLRAYIFTSILLAR